MSNKGKTEGPFGFIASESASRVEHTLQLDTVGQLAFLSGDTAGDLFDLVAIGHLVFDADDELFQLSRDLYHRGQNHNERTIVFALHDLPGHGLDDLGRVEKPMEVDQHQQRRRFRHRPSHSMLGPPPADRLPAYQ